MEIRHLRYLVAVAEDGCITTAATHLNVAQPSLSRQVHDLEDEVGVRLFARNAAGVTLTPAGTACVVVARRILDEVRIAIDHARSAQYGLAGVCVLGAGRYPLWNGLLGRLVEQVRSKYPGIEIVIDDRCVQEQWKALASGELDIGFSTAPPREFSQLEVETHSQDIIDAVVVGCRHPLAERNSVKLADLSAHTWIRPAPAVGDEPTRILQSYFRSQGFWPAATRHAVHEEALRMLVRAGAGWAALPRSLRSVLPKYLKAIPLDDLQLPFRYVLVHRRGDERPLVRSVLNAMRRGAWGTPASSEPPSGATAMPSKCLAIPSKIEMRHLRYFVTTIERETIGRAADVLGISQPALSRQVRDLEEEIGVPLINRGTRGIVATPAGESFAGDARRILHLADRLPSEAASAQRGASGRCVVGAAASSAVWDVMTRAVEASATGELDVDLVVEDIPTPHQLKALDDRHIDLGLGHVSLAPQSPPGIARVSLTRDRLNMALLSTSHPLATAAEISVAELADTPFLFINRAFSPGFYDLVMTTLGRADYAPRIAGGFDGLPTLWALAAQRLGWCLGSEAQHADPPNGLAAVRLRDFDLPWGCEIAYRRDETRHAVLNTVRALQRAAFALSSRGATAPAASS